MTKITSQEFDSTLFQINKTRATGETLDLYDLENYVEVLHILERYCLVKISNCLSIYYGQSFTKEERYYLNCHMNICSLLTHYDTLLKEHIGYRLRSDFDNLDFMVD